MLLRLNALIKLNALLKLNAFLILNGKVKRLLGNDDEIVK